MRTNKLKKQVPHVRTQLIHDAATHDTSSIIPPIYASSTYPCQSNEDVIEKSSTPLYSNFYLRYGGVNSNQAARLIAKLEGAEKGMLAASGMGAISLAILSLVKAGDHVICQTMHYGSALTLFEKVLPKWGVEVSMVDQTALENFRQAVRPNTKLIYVESPVNPLLTITDLKSISKLGKSLGIITLCDNTFATPINQRPIELGIDVVVHSATKGLGGHSDVLAGAIVSRKEIIDQMWEFNLVIGSALSPFDSWLLLRGMRTLFSRVKQQNKSTQSIAAFLASHRKITSVNYPGLLTHPQHKLAQSQMDGFGCVLSFDVKGGFEKSEKMVKALNYFRRAPSLGGVDSLVIHPVGMLAKAVSKKDFSSKGVDPGLVRLSVGLEDASDLIDDLKQALEKI